MFSGQIGKIDNIYIHKQKHEAGL